MDTDDGIMAVRLARNFIIQEVTGKKQSSYMMTPSYNKLSGVFVTINKFPSMELRGCIGFPIPEYPFLEVLEHSARSACHDPRFPDLTENELDNVVAEVTILTSPEQMIVREKKDLLNVINIGKHGLMLEHGRHRAVLLPKVPVECGWNVKEYLENLCMKADLPKDKWKDSDCHLYSFEGKVFKEASPNGKIVEVK